MRTLAVIPSRYEPRRLAALVRQIAAEADVLVLDNGHERPPWLPADVVDARGDGLYAMWNRGADHARERGYAHCAVLNDDIRIARGVLDRLAAALDSDPTLGIAYPAPAGEWRVNSDPLGPYEMTGFAFMFRTDLPVRFDESWGWWCGDVAFERDVLRAGYGVARVHDCPIEHESDAERDSWARRPELRAVADADQRRWAAIVAEQWAEDEARRELVA